MQFGLLGRHLSHSYSPQIHALIGTTPYQLIELEPEALGDFLRGETFDGLNVTIPYKKDVIRYCDILTPVAQKLGAVNTVLRTADGKLLGHNSDYFGFAQMLLKSGLDVRNKKVLVLGSGGASTTVCAVLEESGANVIIISRSGIHNYDNLHLHYDASVIVNATPVGMFPDTNKSPIDLSNFYQLEGVLDLIYNPASTMLLQNAQKKNIVALNGLWMLVAQAKESAQLFLDKKIDDTVIDDIHKTLRKQMANIVLIGMPGCGKSTIGKRIGQMMGKVFVDADEEIVRISGRTIPEIFASSGEAHFRMLESQVLADLGKRSGTVIATGGGCVTRIENLAPLQQNGLIVWIQRDLHSLPTDGRPLSQSTHLADMYRDRKPMYDAFADISIANNSSIENTVNSLLEIIEEAFSK